jgi:hypothetical protein
VRLLRGAAALLLFAAWPACGESGEHHGAKHPSTPNAGEGGEATGGSSGGDSSGKGGSSGRSGRGGSSGTDDGAGAGGADDGGSDAGGTRSQGGSSGRGTGGTAGDSGGAGAGGEGGDGPPPPNLGASVVPVSGGGIGRSTTYALRLTIGAPGTHGNGSSTSYRLKLGP